MKFGLFVKLLDFMPDRTYLYSRGELIGDYDSNWFYSSDREVENMEVKIIKIDRGTAKVKLEVIKWFYTSTRVRLIVQNIHGQQLERLLMIWIKKTLLIII